MSSAYQEFQELGFKYKYSFQEWPEKRILNDTVIIESFSYRGKDCVILLCASKNWANTIKKILNKEVQMETEKIHLPDDVYDEESNTAVLVWNLNDRKIYLAAFERTNKLYIEPGIKTML